MHLLDEVGDDRRGHHVLPVDPGLQVRPGAQLGEREGGQALQAGHDDVGRLGPQTHLGQLEGHPPTTATDAPSYTAGTFGTG